MYFQNSIQFLEQSSHLGYQDAIDVFGIWWHKSYPVVPS